MTSTEGFTFKVGDRVVSTENAFGDGLPPSGSGVLGVIIDIISPARGFPYQVKWDTGVEEVHSAVELKLVSADNPGLLEKAKVFELFDEYFGTGWRQSSRSGFRNLVVKYGFIEPLPKKKEVSVRLILGESEIERFREILENEGYTAEIVTKDA